MTTAFLIATSFSIGFFFESILGFGGGLIAYSILGFFIDIKEMVLAGLYIGICSSGYIAYSGSKFFDKKIFISSTPLMTIGTIIGVLIFTNFSMEILTLFMGIFLILIAGKTIFFDHVTFPKILKNKLIFLGGISQGAFGIGGPFLINALKKDFKSKSSLRTTMAAFFAIFNLARILQLAVQKQIQLDFFYSIWWTIIPIFITIKLGYLVHIRINENLFKKGIAIVTIFAGIKFITKAF